MKTNPLIIVSTTLELLLAGCTNNAYVNANCGDLSMAETVRGEINQPQLPFGAVFYVDRLTKTANYIGSLVLGDLKETGPMDGEVSLNKKWETTFTTEIKDANIKAGIKSLIEKNITLHVKHLTMVRSENWETVLNSNDPKSTQVREKINEVLLPQGSQNNDIYLIWKVGNGDSVALTGTAGNNVGVNGSLMQYGNYEVNVKYSCEQVDKLSGSNTPPIFIGPILLKKSPDGKFSSAPDPRENPFQGISFDAAY